MLRNECCTRVVHCQFMLTNVNKCHLFEKRYYINMTLHSVCEWAQRSLGTLLFTFLIAKLIKGAVQKSARE